MTRPAPTELCKAAVALSYAGYKLLRLYGVRSDGGCICGKPSCTSVGKHPLDRVAVDLAHVPPVHSHGSQRYIVPGMNLGIRTGGALLVLDFDGTDGETTLHRLREQHPEVQQAPTVLTGKGLHCYLQVPEALRGRVKTTVRVAPGLDTRYEKAYVVAPPSQHVSGSVYTWQPGLVALGDLPVLGDSLCGELFPVEPPPATPSPSWAAPRWSHLSLLHTALERYGREGQRHGGALWLAIRAASSGVPKAIALEWARSYAQGVDHPATFHAREAMEAVEWAYRQVLSPSRGWSASPRTAKSADLATPVWATTRRW